MVLEEEKCLVVKEKINIILRDNKKFWKITLQKKLKISLHILAFQNIQRIFIENNNIVIADKTPPLNMYVFLAGSP